jgi:tetratricopeptide (TPR) repeat protein/thiol-disulfide isomerase/thioredoxin
MNESGWLPAGGFISQGQSHHLTCGAEKDSMGPAHSTRLLAAVLVSTLAGTIPASVSSQTTADASASRLRTLFFQRDYETALVEGGSLVGALARAEFGAWYVLNLARSGKEHEAVTAARKMVSDAPTSGWSWLALAGALNYQGEHTDEAIDAGERAFQLMPENADAIWIHAQTMAGDGRRRKEAVALVDNRRSRVTNPAELLVTKAYALYSMSSEGDDANRRAAFDTFEEAQRVDPTNVNALYLHATYLSAMRRSDEAYPLLRKAVALAPGSSPVHQAYWRAVNGSQTLSRENKAAEIQADMTAFLQKHGDRSSALYAVASMSGDLKLVEQQRELEDKILRDFSDTVEAEWVLAYRWREYRQAKEGVHKPEYRQILSDFVARPKHYIEGLLGEAYTELFFILIDDKTTPADQLKRVLEGMLTHETVNVHITHASAPIALADHRLLLPEAERIARDSVDVLKKKVESQREFYKTDGEYERAAAWMTSLGYDALGWVLFAEGRVDEAERELLRSYDLHHESRVNLHHLGKFFEAKGDIPRAEQYYIKGLSVQALGANPCEESLKALYEKRRGPTAGFDTYLTELRDGDRIRRKEKVLGERLGAPEATPAFNLKTLDGTRVALDSLKGKIVVINFWGIWCGWCIHELPEYQKLFEKDKGDADVVIVTIDNDHNPDDVPPWMKQKGYTFPMLLDDGYVAKAGITAFPTTWFLDREGRKVFVKVGWSEELLEEFSWRIEAIRAASVKNQREFRPE